MILVLGLGNPGKEYLKNRHNAGFMAADYLSNLYKLPFNYKAKFNSDLSQGFIGYHRILLVKPAVFMNLSGIAAQSICAYYNISLENIYVIHDDIDLELGRIKIKLGGGNAGHNGLKSIDQYLGNKYWRIRIGVGRPNTNINVSDYVLGNFREAEYENIITAIKKISDNFELIISGKLEEFQRKLYTPPQLS